MYKNERKLIVLVNKDAKDVPVQGSGDICFDEERIELVPKIIKRQ